MRVVELQTAESDFQTQSRRETIPESMRSRRRIVLCGGKSTRMGTSKALLPFGPETMLQRVVRLLSEVVRRSWSSLLSIRSCRTCRRGDRHARRARGPRSARGAPRGPEGAAADVEAAYVTSCDVPLLVPGLRPQMLELARGYDIAVMEIDGFTHPLSAVYRSIWCSCSCRRISRMSSAMRIPAAPRTANALAIGANGLVLVVEVGTQHLARIVGLLHRHRRRVGIPPR